TSLPFGTRFLLRAEDERSGLCRSIRFPAFQQMAVHVDGDLNAGVSHLPLDIVHVLSPFDLQRTKRVAQVVKAHLADASGNNGSRESVLLERVRVHRSSVRRRKYQSGL